MEMAKKKRKVPYILIILILIIVAIGIGAKSYYNNSLGPMDIDNPTVVGIEIPSGSSTNKISEILFDNGLIKNKLIFKQQVKSLNSDGKLKAGKYELRTDMDLENIIANLTHGGKADNTVRFTIPEGYELEHIAEKLSNEGLVNKEKFMELVGDKKNFEEKFEFLKELDDNQSLEGFLFPSTYEVFKGSKEEDIIAKMLKGFEKIYNKDVKDKLDEMNMTLNEAITLASIVEREGKLDKERPLMSAVFHNRLKKGMALQSCATVQYILGERKEVLSIAETQTPSVFNTYINTGLPPAPIAAPGEESIIASLNPADVDYLFFVLTGSDGSHTFTTNYNDHKQAKPKK